MQVLVNSNHVQGGIELQEWVETVVVGQLERFDDLLTRVEIYITDENAHKSGADDKRCQIEFRPKGHQSMSVTHKAESLALAVDGAAEKARHSLETLVGKLDAKVISSGHLNDPLAEEHEEEKDALLQEEFLERQGALGKE